MYTMNRYCMNVGYKSTLPTTPSLSPRSSLTCARAHAHGRTAARRRRSGDAAGAVSRGLPRGSAAVSRAPAADCPTDRGRIGESARPGDERIVPARPGPAELDPVERPGPRPTRAGPDWTRPGPVPGRVSARRAAPVRACGCPLAAPLVQSLAHPSHSASGRPCPAARSRRTPATQGRAARRGPAGQDCRAAARDERGACGQGAARAPDACSRTADGRAAAPGDKAPRGGR